MYNSLSVEAEGVSFSSLHDKTARYVLGALYDETKGRNFYPVHNRGKEITMEDSRLSQFLQKPFVVWAGALISCALWGSAFPCIKLGYAWQQIAADDTAAQILFAGIRFTMAGLLTILIGSLLHREALVPNSFDTVKKAGLLCLFQTVLQYLFFYVGLAHASGVNASIIEGLNVFVAVLIAGLLFRLEKVTAKKLLGCAIGFGGLVIVNLSGGQLGGLAWNGEGFIFISTIAYAFSSVLMKRFSKTENPMLLSGWQFLFGGLIMALWGWVSGGRLSFYTVKEAAPTASALNMPAILMLLWLAFVSAAAYSIWSMLLKYNPVSRVAVFGFMNPVFGVILSAWLLREGQKLGISALLSLVLVCIGIYICNRE